MSMRARFFSTALLLLSVIPQPIPARQTSPAGEAMVEDVQVCGYRRIKLKAILAKIKVRPGDRFSQEQVERDYEAALGLGFDRAASKLVINNGARGGKTVIFDLSEGGGAR